MQKIPLLAVPRQNLSFTVDGAYWQMSVYQSISHMCCDFTRNGVVLIQGIRCLVGTPLLPYPYMSAPSFGNFLFDSDVDWNHFADNTCNLYYLNQSEWADYQQRTQEGLLSANIYAAD